MTLNELGKRINESARAKGFYDTERSPLEYHMLMVSELAEATEAVRSGELPVWARITHEGYLKNAGDTKTGDLALIKEMQAKPEGEAVEIADCLIRILDYCEHRGWDIDAIVELKMAYNATRSYRHGNKRY